MSDWMVENDQQQVSGFINDIGWFWNANKYRIYRNQVSTTAINLNIFV